MSVSILWYHCFMNTKKMFFGVVVLVLIIVAGFYAYNSRGNTSQSENQPISVFYQCDGGKTISALIYPSQSNPNPVPPDTLPKPTGKAEVKLSDGRDLSINQTISADGVRYANTDESFIFWSKGNGALVLENNEQKSYIGCIKIADDSGNLPEIYGSGSNGFSIRYPSGYSLNDKYQYQAFGPDKTINGVSFTIPKKISEGTNLSDDSYISVEQIPQINNCSADIFLANSNAKAESVTDNSTEYSVASSTDAGLGNRYEEAVYALPYTNPCTAIRYFIHYGVIENYDPSMMVKEFDKKALISKFDEIRRTLVVE